jgi:hypothetical protein
MNEILTVEDMAALLDCEPETVQARQRANDLPGVKVGKSWICPRSALLAVLHDKAMSNMVPDEKTAPKAVKVAPVRPQLVGL